MPLTNRRSPKLAPTARVAPELRDAIDTLEDRPRLPRKTPASGDDGYLGEVCADDNYVYVRGTSAWKRLSLNSY